MASSVPSATQIAGSALTPLLLVNRHTGERLELMRFEDSDGQWLQIKGSLPSQSQGPPLHIHELEDEGGRVISGTLTALLNGRVLRVAAGEEVSLPRGQPHRWWNDGHEELVFEGFAKPVVDLDRHLQAIFDVVNAGPSGRPPLFYLAHVTRRHRHTQRMLTMPRMLEAVLMPVVVLIGHLLGRYRGADWPGSPSRCKGAPLSSMRV